MAWVAEFDPEFLEALERDREEADTGSPEAEQPAAT